MAAAAIATKNQIAEAISSVTPKVDDEHCCRKISKIEQLFTNGVPQPLRSHGFSLRKRSSLCKR
jgi:hypothetical protein